MMKQEGASSMISDTARRQRESQRGSVIVYILIAIFLTGLLVAAMSQGTKKSASSEQIDEVMLYLPTDIQTVQSNITECVLSYQNNNFCPPTGCQNQYNDGTNPNVPFPVYSDGSSTGASGNVLATIQCPRAPSGQKTIFTDSITQSLKLLQDTANYTTTYFNTSTDGVYLQITRAVSDPIWTETLARLPSKYASCSSLADTTNTYSTCPNGCFYYFILRRAHTGSSVFPACP
jgi:hypothetical protein